MRLLAILSLATAACAQQGDQPRVVAPGRGGEAPSDAVVLGAAKWRTAGGQPSKCTESGGVLTCATGAGDIYSSETFRSAQIHVEFAIPSMPNQKGQLRGNSGVYLQGRYEVQVLDSFENPTYITGMLGALYGQAAPLVNAARKPEEWQSYDIVFRAPKCNAAGAVEKRATLTVLLNGVLVQDHVEIDPEKADQKRKAAGIQGVCEPGPLLFQDHSGFPGAPHTVLKFRNLWFRRLD